MELNSKIQINSIEPSEVSRLKKGYVSFSAGRPASVLKLCENGLNRRAEKKSAEILKTENLIVRLTHYFSKDIFTGDRANVIITGLGTGIVAPIMIKHNPLSKEDGDTKTYAAWRQPISAVIAIITQVGITTKVANYIKKLAKIGYMDKDMDISVSDKYKRKQKELEKKAEFLGSISEIPESAEILRINSRDPLKKGLKPDKTGSAEKIRIYLENKLNFLKKKVQDRKTNKRLEKAIKELQYILSHPEERNAYIEKQIQLCTKGAKKWEEKALKITDNVKFYSDAIGIGLALATLPLTCDLLNWVYPRFMKLVFPELTNKKEQKPKNNNDYITPFAKEIKPYAEEVRP